MVEFSPVHLNLPHESPCYGGFVPTKALADADVGLLVDVDVPWIPKRHAGESVDLAGAYRCRPEKRAIPMWTFPANLRLQGDSRHFYADLLAALKAKPMPASSAAQRRA